MRIGIRAHDVPSETLEDLFSSIHKNGFSCMHLALYRSIKELDLNTAILTPGFAMYLKDLINRYHVNIAVLGCSFNLCHPNPEKQKEIVNNYMSYIRLASIIGSCVVGSETGALNKDCSYEPANHSDKALELFINNLRPVVKYAEQFGVILSLEPSWNQIVHTAERARKVLDEINSPNLQITFDPVNLLSIGNYKEQDSIVNESFDILEKDIAIVHCKDFIVENNTLRSVAAGNGQFNYQSFIDKIKQKKPFIDCILENTTPQNAVSARGFIEHL